MASEYLAARVKSNQLNPHQVLKLEMHTGASAKTLSEFNQMVLQDTHHTAHIQALSLNFYENEHLFEEQFFDFCKSIANFQDLRKLEVNLRWCHQVQDSWIKALVEHMPHNTLEYLELWLCKTSIPTSNRQGTATRCTRSPSTTSSPSSTSARASPR